MTKSGFKSEHSVFRAYASTHSTILPSLLRISSFLPTFCGKPNQEVPRQGSGLLFSSSPQIPSLRSISSVWIWEFPDAEREFPRGRGLWRLKERKGDWMVSGKRPGWGGVKKRGADYEFRILVQVLSLRLYITLGEVLAPFWVSVSPFVKQG